MMNNLFNFGDKNVKKLTEVDNEQLLLIVESSLTECFFRYLKSRKDITYEIATLPAFLYTNEETQEQEAGTMQSKNMSGFKSVIDSLIEEYSGEKFYFYKCYIDEGQFYVSFAHLPVHTHLCEEFL